MRRTFDCSVDSPRVPVVCGRWIALSLVALPSGDPWILLTCVEYQRHSRTFGTCASGGNWTVKSLDCSQRLVLQELNWSLKSIQGLGRKSAMYTDRMVEINLLHRSLTGLNLSRCPYFGICIRSQTLLYAHGRFQTLKGTFSLAVWHLITKIIHELFWC